MRPSSKGVGHLTVTWKVADDQYQHIDVTEEGKSENGLTSDVGKKLLIGKREFEDIDEILATYVTPMADYVRKLSNEVGVDSEIFLRINERTREY